MSRHAAWPRSMGTSVRGEGYQCLMLSRAAYLL